VATNDLFPTFDPDSYELSVESQLDINEKSKVYPIFCSYGCFKQPRLSVKLYVDKAMPYSSLLKLRSPRTRSPYSPST
jgi:hypothetical protein